MTAVPATAFAGGTTLGSFTKHFQRKNQPHRVYVQVTAGKGAKDCSVTLAHKTIQVSLGTNKVSNIEYLFFVHPRVARKALRQARRAPSGRADLNTLGEEDN